MSQTQDFVVSARSPDNRRLSFVVLAETHRDAWKRAREVCKTGEGARSFAPNDEQLELQPATFTVQRVLARTPHRKGRPPKLTIEDFKDALQRSNVQLSKRCMAVIGRLS